MQDYVVWSAPVSDLSDWKYEGVSYRKDQDPSNPGGERALQAPDVAKGPDGEILSVLLCDFCAGNRSGSQ